MCRPLQLQRSKTLGAFQEAEELVATPERKLKTTHFGLRPLLVFSHRLYRRIALRTRRSCCCMPSLSARADAVRTRHWQVLQNWRAFRQMFNEPTVQNRNDDCAFERVSNGGKGIRIPGLATIGCCTAGTRN